MGTLIQRCHRLESIGKKGAAFGKPMTGSIICSTMPAS
jgi:hypothetical protein